MVPRITIKNAGWPNITSNVIGSMLARKLRTTRRKTGGEGHGSSRARGTVDSGGGRDQVDERLLEGGLRDAHPNEGDAPPIRPPDDQRQQALRILGGEGDEMSLPLDHRQSLALPGLRSSARSRSRQPPGPGRTPLRRSGRHGNCA